MSPSRSNTPPDAMTWKRALPVLILCGIFDISRAFFSMFWLFGPVIAVMYCASGASGILGTILAAICAAAAGTAGYFLSPALVTFGVIMAMVIGLVGWMTIGLILIMFNARIIKENASASLNLLASLGVGEAPLINAVPALTFTVARLYRTQIRKEHKELKAWEKAHAAQLQQEREARLQQVQQARQAQEQDEQEFEDEQIAQQEEEASRAASAQDDGGGQGGEGSPRANGTGVPANVDDSAEVQFETMHDALSELNDKQNRTLEENARLLKAEQIMKRGTLNQNEGDPVLRAAYERSSQGQKVYDGTPETRNGFKFINLRR
jgi:hypothetical protein